MNIEKMLEPQAREVAGCEVSFYSEARASFL